jgi:hypothetical protein
MCCLLSAIKHLRRAVIYEKGAMVEPMISMGNPKNHKSDTKSPRMELRALQ